MSISKPNRFKGLMQAIRQDATESTQSEIKSFTSTADKEQIPALKTPPAAPEVIWVPHKKIHRDLSQARRYFDPDEISNMAASMKSVGMIDPLSVRRRLGTEEAYDLLAGEKRHRSAELAELAEVPVRVFDVDDSTAEDIKAISNLQRSDLNKWEETNAIMGMLCRNLDKDQAEIIRLLNQAANQKRGLTDNVVRNEDWAVVEDVFAVVGRLTPESFRKHRVPLLKLPEHIQTVLQQGKLHYTKVNEILKVKNPEQQRELLERAITDDLSVDQIQVWVKELRQVPSNEAPLTSGELPTSQRFTVVTQQVRKAKIWNDPKKSKRLERLLSQLEELLQ